jgi:DNA-directed RNA polymerase specialized sigma24 family protein
MERQQAVRASLSRLDERCRTLLIELFGIGDQPSYEDVADRLGLLPNSVGPTRRRCLDKLLEDLEKTTKGLF